MARKQKRGTHLTQLGLSAEQASIYQTLLESRELSAMELSNVSGVQRTYIYSLSKQLEEMGLVTQEKKGRTTLFRAQSPDLLLGLVEKQKQQAEQAQRTLDGLLPSLKESYVSRAERPVVTYYEGFEGVKKAYNDTLVEPTNEICAFLDTSTVDPEFRTWLKTVYAPKRTAANIPVRVILASGKLMADFQRDDEKFLRETRAVSREQFPIRHEINIYGEKVSFLYHVDKEKMLAIMFHHPHIAQTMKAWFELAWLAAK
jgi:sugar-specific transcriptional regulator TrmB